MKRMAVNDREMLNVYRITKNWLGPVVQLDVEAATVNCYITLFRTSEVIRRPSVIPVEIDWLVKPENCVYMTLTLIKYADTNSTQTYNHVIMYLNRDNVVKTSILSNLTDNVKKIRCMLEKLSGVNKVQPESVNKVQYDLGLKNGILLNESVIDLYYKMVDYLYENV